MNIVAYDKSKIENPGSYKRTKWQKIIEEFIESGLDCVKVEDWTHKTATSATAALNRAIERYNHGGFRAVERNDEVFIIKTE